MPLIHTTDIAEDGAEAAAIAAACDGISQGLDFDEDHILRALASAEQGRPLPRTGPPRTGDEPPTATAEERCLSYLSLLSQARASHGHGQDMSLDAPPSSSTMRKTFHHLPPAERDEAKAAAVLHEHGEAPGLVARSVGKAEIAQVKAADEAIKAEWDKLISRGCWDASKVRSWHEVKALFDGDLSKLHVGSLHEICVEKGSELPK